jgi:hypothetical protein
MRACTLALSVIAHLLLLALVVVIPLFANDTLPDRRRVLEFVQVMPVSIPSPPPRSCDLASSRRQRRLHRLQRRSKSPPPRTVAPSRNEANSCAIPFFCP